MAYYKLKLINASIIQLYGDRLYIICIFKRSNRIFKLINYCLQYTSLDILDAINYTVVTRSGSAVK